MSDYFKHPAAIVETEHVGPGTRIWAFAHVLGGAVIGRDCNICDHVFIEGDVRVGDRVTVKCGVQLWDGVTLEDDVFIGPNATFTNDAFPRSRRYPERFAKTTIRQGASIGANATILPGITVGRQAMVGAAAVVTFDVPPYAIVAGNPAQVRGYVDARSEDVGKDAGKRTPHPHQQPDPGACRVRGASLVALKSAVDVRGSLAVAQLGDQLPFVPRRLFFVYDVPSREVRGEHAHRVQEQLLVCVKGACAVVVDDGESREELRLDAPERAVHIQPLVWGIQYRFTPDAVLVVAASGEYDPDEYIRDYDEFLALVRTRQSDATARRR